MIPRLPTRVWHLAMEEPGALRPARERPGGTGARAEVPLGPLNRFFYEEVGREHHWIDRLTWDARRWQAYAATVETWIASVRGTPAGYAELVRRPRELEVRVFGILAPF